MYYPQRPPANPGDLQRFLQRELQRVSLAFRIPRSVGNLEFENQDSVINRVDKDAGTSVFDTASGKPLWATGPNPTDTWVDAAGTTIYTPVDKSVP